MNLKNFRIIYLHSKPNGEINFEMFENSIGFNCLKRYFFGPGSVDRAVRNGSSVLALIFIKGKEEILDKLVKLNSIDEGKFEEELKKRLWSQIVTHFLDEIYLPSEENASSASEFNTLGLDDKSEFYGPLGPGPIHKIIVILNQLIYAYAISQIQNCHRYR